ncbi:alpha/beta hydrolase [Tahibacter caeni]|uniref:alpha/beta hydrolase n=1 Tax=Tahibacter caeni TaxID=1453545 RepID=UPI002148015A|nr:alpha/beta hydrolase [Tahibacter caeni]
MIDHRMHLARIVAASLLLLAAAAASAGNLRERIAARRAASAAVAEAPLPPGTRVLRDLPYGDDPRQRFDAYLPADAHDAPLIVFVHGGAWAIGDKDNPGIVPNKAAYWLPKGYAFVSVNYRMLPEAEPLTQADDVAHAVAAVQRLARSWNADPARVVLMGHSAGAHLVALLGADPARLKTAGAQAPRGVVSLDSAAMNVVQIMQFPRHFGFYDRAFGSDPAYWTAASPYHALSAASLPLQAVCSTQRADSCPQARAFAEKARGLGVRVDVQPEDLSHAQINHELGAPSAYTEAVGRFVASLVGR